MGGDALTHTTHFLCVISTEITEKQFSAVSQEWETNATTLLDQNRMKVVPREWMVETRWEI